MYFSFFSSSQLYFSYPSNFFPIHITRMYFHSRLTETFFLNPGYCNYVLFILYQYPHTMIPSQYPEDFLNRYPHMSQVLNKVLMASVQ